MGYKTLELTVISAKDLKNVNLIGKMDVYVVVYLSDDPKHKQKTPVHQDGGTEPSWNYTMRFTIDEAAASKPGKYLVFQLRHQSTFGDKDLGEVLVSLKELLDGVQGKKDQSAPQFLTYQVRKSSSGKAKGELKFSCKFVDMAQSNHADPRYKPCSSTSTYSAPPPSSVYPPPPGPAAAYPPPGAPGAYPPPGSAAQQGYPLPSPAGHHEGGVYPPPQKAHEGYPSQQAPPPMGVPYSAAPPPAQGYPPYAGYPPPPAGYGYPPPPGSYSAGYPAAYPPAGYAQPQKPKKNNFGLGLGAGLLGGAVGGLVLGEMVDGAIDNAYESGYDAGFDNGFDDGGGFDF